MPKKAQKKPLHPAKQSRVSGANSVSKLCPEKNNKRSEFLAAKLYYKMLSYKFLETQDDDEEPNFNENSPFSKISKFKDELED